MVITFTEDEDYPLVETVVDRIDFEEGIEETASNAGSEVSMSEFDGLPSELPPECLFGLKECRGIFKLSSDQSAFYRVCGHIQGACKRSGHATGPKADIGYYEPIKARKYFDGKLNSFLSIEDFAVREKERGEAKVLEMNLASSSLATRKENPRVSKEERYRQVRPSYAAMVSNQMYVSEDEDLKVAAKPPPVDTIPLMSTGEVFLKSPTLKKLDASGVPSNAVDPATMMMIGMMDEMKRTMERMNSELTALKVSPSKGEKVIDFADVSKSKPAFPIQKEISSVSKSEAYYGVVHGLEGISGVFRSWGEVCSLVKGVSKASCQKFRSYDEAQEFVDISLAVKAKQMSELPAGMPSSDTWYTVTNSKVGKFSVFPSWATAEQHVTHVSGASVRKFCTYGEAQSYVEGHRAAWNQRFSDESPTATTRTGEAVPDAGSHLLAKTASDLHVDEGTSPSFERSTAYPPGELMGEDPSMGKAEELFGIDTEQSEEELMDALCPPDLSESMARSLINGTIDAVALPGGLNSGGELEGSSSEVGMLGEALEELVTQNRGSEGGRTIKTDLRWRLANRTALRGVTDEHTLRLRIRQLKKLIPKVYKRMETLTSSLCKRSGWTDRVRIHTWGTYGFLPVIVASSLRWYVSLHEHLLEISTECGWSYVTMEIDHHVEELGMLRTMADSRIHAICLLFCYLRDGKDKSWYSTIIQQKRNLAVAKSEAFSSPSSDRFSDRQPSSYPEIEAPEMGICKHCRTCLHPGGMEACPWRNQSPDNARKSGAKALRNLALGTPVRPKKGKEKEAED